MEFYGYLAFGAIGYIVGVLTMLTAWYYITRTVDFQAIIFDMLNDLSQSEDSLKNLYQIGGIIGSGIKGGIGIDTATRGRGSRFKWQDIAVDLASQFISKSLNNPSPSPGPSPSPESINILTQKPRDKW